VALFWAIQGFPSVLFWSSTLGKDPLTFFAIGLYFWGGVGMLTNFRFRHLVGFTAGVLFATAIRLWLAPILTVPFMLAYVLFSRRRLGLKVTILVFIGAGSIFFLNQFQERFRIQNGKDYLKRLNTISRGWKSGGSAQEVPEMKSAKDFVVFAPRAMFTALFRPLPGEVNNMFGALAGLENFALLALFLWGLVKCRKVDFQNPTVAFSLLLLFVWSAVYGLISFQNLGTASRFKLMVFPVILILPFFVWDRQQTELLARAGVPGE
jgi:hypothetical protein